MIAIRELFEMYQHLPEKDRYAFKTMIEEETIDISLPALRESIKQVNLLKKGKAKTRPASELLRELQNG